MGNQFATCKEIARQILPVLSDNLVMPNLIHKDFSADFVPGKGAKIQVRKPVKLTASEFDAAAGTKAQDIKEETVEVALDHLATVDVDISAVEMATSIDDLVRTVITPAAVALAEKINADGLKLYRDIPYAVGTPGTTPSTLDAFSAIRAKLNANKAPMAGRRAIWDVEADAAFTKLDTLVAVDKAGTNHALREGEIGRVYGLDNFMSQAVAKHESGTLATAGTSGKKMLLQGDATAASQITIDTDDTALTGTLVHGDLLQIGTQTVVVTKGATAASNKITVEIYPALTAADNTEVKLMGNHVANMAFQESAFAFVTRPLIAPAGVESYVVNHNGITLRVVRGYNMQYKKEMISVDVLYGYKTMYPELAVTYMG